MRYITVLILFALTITHSSAQNSYGILNKGGDGYGSIVELDYGNGTINEIYKHKLDTGNLCNMNRMFHSKNGKFYSISNLFNTNSALNSYDPSTNKFELDTINLLPDYFSFETDTGILFGAKRLNNPFTLTIIYRLDLSTKQVDSVFTFNDYLGEISITSTGDIYSIYNDSSIVVKSLLFILCFITS